MSEKLTVAELLARNGRGSSESSTERPRRRRRNLETGGVSVAELTGSIPVVTQDDVDEHKASKSAKAAGSTETANRTAAKDAAGEKITRKAEKPGETTNQMAAVPDSETKRPSSVDTKLETKVEAKDQTKAEEHKSPVKQPSAAQPVAGKKPTEKAADRKPVDAKPADKADSAKEQKPAQTESRKREKAATPVSGKEARAAESALIGGGAAAAGTDAASTASASASSASAEDKTKAEAKEVASDKNNDKNNDAQPSTRERKPLPKKKDRKPDEFAALEASLDEDEVIDYEDDTISWPAMLLQAVVAIAAGVGIFFGFSLMWSNLPSIVVLVLALAVTLVVVGLVHALLRHNDKLLMILALVVGLILTFGPRFVIGI